jgi:hypothetical protein
MRLCLKIESKSRRKGPYVLKYIIKKNERWSYDQVAGIVYDLGMVTDRVSGWCTEHVSDVFAKASNIFSGDFRVRPWRVGTRRCVLPSIFVFFLNWSKDTIENVMQFVQNVSSKPIDSLSLLDKCSFPALCTFDHFVDLNRTLRSAICSQTTTFATGTPLGRQDWKKRIDALQPYFLFSAWTHSVALSLFWWCLVGLQSLPGDTTDRTCFMGKASYNVVYREYGGIQSMDRCDIRAKGMHSLVKLKWNDRHTNKTFFEFRPIPVYNPELIRSVLDG